MIAKYLINRKGHIKMVLSEEAKEARRKYDREYYKKNPEKQKEKMRRYWERKASKKQEEIKTQTEEASSKLKESKGNLLALSEDLECMEEIIGEAETNFVLAEEIQHYRHNHVPVYISREDIDHLINIVNTIQAILE